MNTKQSHDYLILIMEVPILVIQYLYVSRLTIVLLFLMELDPARTHEMTKTCWGLLEFIHKQTKKRNKTPTSLGHFTTGYIYIGIDQVPCWRFEHCQSI